MTRCGILRGAADYDVLGCFLSPFEGRILVVYSLFSPGFEGSTTSSRGFSGCSLDVGYH